MRQYFYLVGHDIVGDDFVADKIFLQEHEAIRWGRRRAIQYLDHNYKLYKQEITRTGKLEFVKQLKAFLTPEDALRIASKHHLEAEVKSAMNSGMSPFEACIEWDLI